ncbi:phosphatidylinositol transfer protein csr1 [Conoideocrella luteorostrata]|uniref:Phosphatidylinositol transfer protein csr1 n=1 Tax=Conoideocrella luteorostrata TaxID=1105319 RepID=A0AAJ0CRN2_9HYPO|nr:phosphatidylinositol transfer protein csr1 [Conoideocrella luteorostrata]
MSKLQKRQSYASSTTAAASMAPTIAHGYLGNLTEPQEAKLRALWAIGLKFIEIYEADEATSKAKTLEEKYVPPAKKSKSMPRGKCATHDKYPTLVTELLSLLPTDEQNLEKLAKQAVEALDHWTPHMYRLIVPNVVKHEHPDALALRFLRACDWDLIEATKMMGKTIYWRTMEAAVDDDIMKLGEGGSSEDEKNSQGLTRTLGADFMKQARWGKSFLHGTDRLGRPITYIRVRLHRSSDQCVQSLERYTIYLLELARLSLRHPIEMGTVLLDLSGFRLANFDLKPLKFLLKCVDEYYPDSVALLLIHNAPFGAKTLYRLIRFWLDPALVKKVRFTYGKRGLQKYIAPNQIIKELGGEEDWEYEYEEPRPNENLKMNNTATRDCLMEERRAMAMEFEELTREWIMNGQLSEKAREVCARRDRLVDDLAANYWELDPYVRARSVYDRQGYFRGAGGVEWYSRKLEEESVVSLEKVSSAAEASHHENTSSVGYESSVYDSD